MRIDSNKKTVTRSNVFSILNEKDFRPPANHSTKQTPTPQQFTYMSDSVNDSLFQQMSNIPNRISMVRLALSIVAFIVVPLHYYWLGFVLFVVAASTDWVDGWYARKHGLVTKLGRILDPFCDKILICGMYILLAVEMNQNFPWYARIVGWMAVVVVGRELLVTVLRSMIEGGGGDFSAKMAGKLKMVFQCFAVGSCLVALAIKVHYPEAELPVWISWFMVTSIWISVASTIHSGILYIFGAAEFLQQSVSD